MARCFPGTVLAEGTTLSEGRGTTAALELIAVDYEELPVVADAIAATRSDAALVHEDCADGNLLKHIKVEKGDIDTGFAQADVIIDQTYRTPATEHLFLEPECAIGVPASSPM